MHKGTGRPSSLLHPVWRQFNTVPWLTHDSRPLGGIAGYRIANNRTTPGGIFWRFPQYRAHQRRKLRTGAPGGIASSGSASPALQQGAQGRQTPAHHGALHNPWQPPKNWLGTPNSSRSEKKSLTRDPLFHRQVSVHPAQWSFHVVRQTTSVLLLMLLGL